MKTLTLLPIVLFLSAISYAQTGETITAYFDDTWETITDKSRASYYRTTEYKGTRILVRDYFISGKIQMLAECIQVNPALKFDGKATVYYENGVVKNEGNYVDNKQVGIHKTYYENGNLESETRYKDDKATFIHFLAADGTDLLPNGFGTLLTSDNHPWLNYTIVEDSVTIATYAVNATTRDTVFTMTEKMAEFKGGLPALGKYLSAEVKYPKSARRQGLEGTVYVGFIVDKRGNVIDCSILKGIGPDCDQEAIRTVQLMGSGRWIPGKFKDAPVASRFVLPIKFRLTP